jgi:hypothetical protein
MEREKLYQNAFNRYNINNNRTALDVRCWQVSAGIVLGERGRLLVAEKTANMTRMMNTIVSA